MSNTTDEEIAVAELHAMVTRFNLDFGEWRLKHGMVATFGWGYIQDDSGETAVKRMEVLAIDRTIFRKAPPSAEHFSRRLADLAGEELPNSDS